ncbi:MAG: TolC family protein [Pseudomonadota bacterium]
MTGRARFALAAAALALGGCASFSQDGGFGAVQEAARERLGKELRWKRTDADAQSIRARVRELLARPLSDDDAVQVALLNSPALQAAYAELGIAEADLVQAASGPNLRLHALRTKYGSEVAKVEESFSFEILGVLLMPLRRKMEARRFERVQADVTAEVLRTALEARKAWIAAVAAEEALRYAEQVKTSAEAASELARRMAEVGNWPKLNHMREQAFYAEAAAQHARAKHAAVAARERLARSLGLWGEDLAFRLPERLPDLPPAPRVYDDLERRAIEHRLDVRAARRELDWLAEALGLSKATRLVSAVEFSRARTKEGPDPFAYGYVLGLEIPIFDWGRARVARAEATYRQAVERLVDTAVRARSEVRESYAAYRSAYDLARHYRDELVPLRKRISEEVLLRYNGMLASAFELLADAREQVATVTASLEAKRDFWMADTELQANLSGRTMHASAEPPAAPARMPAGAGRGH